MSTTTLRSAVARTPHTTAVVLGEEEVSYADLNRRANQLANYLQALGVGPDMPVGVLLERSVETIVTLLAIFKAGGAYVPLEPAYPDERLRFMVRDAGLELVVTQERLTSRLGDTMVQSIRVDADWADIANESQDNPPLRAGAANLAYIIYTSGSSGTPKGAMVTRGGMLNCLNWMQQRYKLTAQDAFLMHTSLNFDPSVWEVFWPLLVGARIVIAPAGMLESSALLRYMAEQSVTCAYFVPSQLGMLVQEPRLSECRNLRYVISGGEKLPLPVMREFQELSRAELHHSYGPTETAIAATEWTCEAGAERILMGRPIGNTQVYVLDGQMEPVPVGVAGELYIGGVGVGRGYTGRVELTAERFVPDRFSAAPGARLYRTGDLVRYDAEGNLEFVGRVDQQVKLRGYRIELGEIEAVLRRHDQVSAAVVVLNEADGDKRLVAYVVSDAEAGALREYLKAHLPEYMVPSFFVALNELPLLPNGKLNRRALPAPESMVVAEAEYAAPRTATEELLAGMWARVLRVNRVGINDNFFALGGHSLLATQVIARVRDAFGQEVELRTLFEQPTVAGLAQTIEIAQLAGAGLSAPPLMPIARDAELPLSFAQQRLWFLDQLEASGSFYNLPAAVRLTGELDVAALERTLSEIIRRHEALRTSFESVNGEPKQIIKPFTPFILPVFDLSELNPTEREAETQRLLSEEASRPFDLARGPLVRACLVRLGATEHVALVTMHHIISDGWSMGVFIREVATLYGAYVRGEESSLEELPIQYADFAHWQRGWLQGEVLAAQVSYWREALADAPAMLELPADYPRPREQTFNGAMLPVVVPAELTQQLKALSQRERVTVFMTLLAAFQSLLFRHSGQGDIVVGTPIANRRYRELEDLIGFFVNTLALRASSLDSLTFTELLHRVREVTLGAYAHQDLPFEKLVEELQPERDLSRNPIFQVMFALQNAPLSALELPGLRLEGEGVESQATRFDLECHLREDGEVLSGVFVYNTDLFEPATIERLVVNYQTVLQSIAANPSTAVASLRLLRAEDERQLVYGWNETSIEFPRGVVHDLFAQQVERTPHDTAVVFDDVSLTFAELNQRSSLLANFLQGKGVGPDTVVGVMLGRSVEMLVAVLGVLKAGGAYLPLDPEYPAERLLFMLADAQVRVLLTQEQLEENTGADVEIIRLDTDWPTIVAQAVDEDPRAEVTSDNLAYVIYTSGSTGQPKGVTMTHRPLVNLLHWQMHRSGAAPRTLQFTSLSFDVSFQEIFSTWCAGGALVLMREEARRDADELWQLLIRERIERLFLPFVALQYLAEASEHTEEYPVTLREVITAGEQLKITRYIRSLFAKLNGCTLDNQYGPSETHVVSALMLEGDAAAWPELPAIGRPIANAQLYLLDERLQVVPIGAAGEVYIGGEVVARGYLNRPAASAEKFLPHPFMVDGSARLYRTGDQARYLVDGNIEFLGRRDQLVKVRGYRIELGEVEATLRQQEQVREAVVISSAVSSGENRLIAYVLTDKETSLTTTALRARLKELLPEYMIPAAFVLLEEFPLTPSGKIDRRALQARPVEFEAGESMLARTPAEEIVAAIWAEVLGRDVVGVHDNFFELGGHSLLATQVISRVRDAFRQEVALRTLFEQPTVAGLAQSIEQQQRAGAGLMAPPLVRITGAERLPLSFAQQRLWFLDQMEPGRAFYNIPAAVRLRGVLNIKVLELTLSEVVRRHEVLRTRFIAVDGEPVQVIDEATPIKLEALDLSALDEEAREAEMLRMVRVETSLPFDLSRGPLLRVSLIRLHAEDHVAAVTMPHIVTDGWSMGIFINEVATLYGAYVRGNESPLEELPIQYADFAHWQRGWLQGEVLAAQLDYWREELADAPTVIDLPIDKPRPPVQTYRGAHHPVQLSLVLSSQLRELSRRHGSTLFMTLLAAFDLLLCRYTGQEQVLVGSPIANRNRSETEGLIGFFINTLVLRGDVRGNPSFRELLRRVRETALGAYAHQDLPFEKLVEELQPDRDMSRPPLFQVTFTLQNAPSEALELEGLSLSGVETTGDTAKFELTLVLGEAGGMIVGAMEYNPDLFEAATIARLVESYERVLQAVAADAEQRVLEIDLLSEAERQQIVEGWNETRREYIGAQTLHRLFEAQAARRGEAVAVVFEGEQLSYAELDRRSNQLAHHLVSLGVSPDSLVAVCLDRSLELFVALLAILKAGAAYLPLDPSYPLARLSFMLADAGSPLLLTTESLADELPAQWTLPLLLDADWDLIALNTDEALPEMVVSADQLAYVMYTSGSTGTPKGVAVTHGGVVRLVTEPNYVRLDQQQTLLQLAPMTFDASTLEVWGALLNGGRLVVMPPGAPTLDEISRVIVDQEVTTLWLTAGLFHLMVDEQLEGLSHVKQLLAGGDVLSVHHVEKYLAAISSDRRLINGYGPTENTTFTCCHVMDGQTRLNGSVPIGRPITNTQVYVLDAAMQVAPLGVVGELYIGGAGLARGYFNQPELTAERFVPHPHSMEAGERLYRTGDMVRWRKQGELEFIGRIDGQVKIRGFRIEVGEIDAVLAVHPGVREAVVLVREDERGDKRLAAYVVTAAESEVTAEELRDYLRERLPEYMQVQWVVDVEELPLTANGKVDRRALQALEVEIAGGESVQARTPAEEILSAIWAEVLGRETVSVHDNFFELGGHSLLATQVISRVRDAFGQEVALRSLFEQPTVAGLAREIDAGRGAELQAPPLERVGRVERLPLSFAQQRLWFLDQLEAGSSFYNIPAAVRLHGVLNVEALERTLSEVVRRHEVLRTHFVSIDGEPVQVIEAATPIKLEVLDLSDLDEAERTAETQRLVAEESARPFDLTTGPLLRMSLIRLGAEEHVALVMMHHIISDGWSIGVLVREVAVLYSAYVRGEESPLEELTIQYADFAHWQRNWLQGEVLDAQLDYWRAELADAPTVIDLPIDKPRPPVQTYRGAHHPLQLSAELSSQLRDLSRQNGSTLFMTLLAAFDLLLCRYAGQEQVLVGTPIANRNRSETEALIGFFVNTLVLRGDVRGNPSFRELLRRVRGTALGAYAHQDLPFEKLVEELQPDRDMSRSPLFQVMFVLQNAPGEALELEGLSLSGVESAGDTVKFELMLGLEEVGEVVAGGINYNRDLYEAETIRRLVNSYERVLRAVVTDAEQRVFEIELLSEAERQQIIEGWNDTAAAYPRELSLSELFEVRAARTPEAAALRFEDTVLSYRELNERANQLARYLQRSGVGPEVLVGILMSRSVEMIVAVLGILKSGGAYVPLDPSYPLERLAFMVHDSGLQMLLTQEQLSEVPGGYMGETLSLNEQWDSIAGESTENLASSAQPESLAYVIYTSGSTGRPKGVMIQQRSVVNLATALQHSIYQQYGPALRIGLSAPLAFDASVKQVVQLLHGHTLCILPEEARADARQLLDYIERYRLDSLDCTPSHLKLLGPDGVKSLLALAPKLVLVGGEALDATVWPQLVDVGETRFFNIYGPTECTVDATVCAVSAELPASTIGRPLPNVQVYVLDQRQQPVGIGIPGEICIGGEGVGRGYLNQPWLTAERFIPNPYSKAGGARLYRTGDVGRYLSDGNIEHLGRLDDQVKLRGFRIELGEIEAVLASHPAVSEVAVVLREDKSGDTRLVAYVVGEEATGAMLRGYLRERVPEYMVPAAFVLLERMPLTPNGKIDRRALPAPDAKSLVLGSGYVAPRTAVEQITASIWSQLLDVEQIGVEDNFFELGGHSLLATQVISRVRDAFGQEVALRSLFEQPTVAGLAQTIERAQRADVGLSAPPLVPISRDVELPLSFAQQRLWFLDQMEPGSSFYNIPAAVRLRGALNIEALERTLSEVVRRHEVLRTHFLAIDGEPVQVIEPATPIKLEVLDLSDLEEAERTAETQRLVAEESARPFNLTTGPLLRMSLIRLGAEEHVALVMMHHIVSDGWSIGVLVREVAALYGAYLNGEESALEELPIQYADFAHWQRGWLQGEVLAAQLDYWRAELADAPTAIDLPIDKPRPPVQTYRGAYHPLQLSTELSSQLRDLSRRHGSTLFMTLLAAFDLLLCRYAGQEQVLVGTPIANRNRSETEALIGFFVNTLVLRGDVRRTPSFRELLRRVRETALSAYAHQDLPFEKLVEELQPERDMSRSPLVQVTFTWQNAPSEALQLEGLSLSEVESAGDTVKFEMSLGLEERGGAIVGAMAYNRDLFEAATIERLLASYERVLQAVVTDAEQRVLEIDLLSEAERQQIVEGWNETRREYIGALTLHRLFEAQAARRGEAVAVVFEGDQLSYAELDRRSNQLAHHLVSLGVSSDSLVAVCLDRSLELFVSLLAILKAGAAYLPLDPSYPLARLSFMLADAGSPLLLTTESLADELPAQWTLPLLLDADWDLIALNPDEALPEMVVAADQLAYVMYTSGSTGTPKGVAVTHGGVVRLVTEPNYVRLDQQQTLLQLAPMTFDASTLEVWGALLNGGRLVVMPPSAPTLDEISRVIVDQEVTTLWLTAGLFHLMVDEQLEGLSHVKQLLAGGDVLSVHHVEKYLAAISSDRRLINGYGPTENTTFTCCHVMDGNTGLNGSVPIGRPITNTQVYVLDAAMQVVPTGVVGELYIGGAGLARGYFNQPELTAERFVPHPHSTEAGERLYRTGDMVRWRKQGELEFIGRIDGQVKIRGFRIEVGEIEAVLVAHAGVREAVVLVREDERSDKRLAAYVVKDAESEVSAGELKEYLRERLPEYMQVQWVVEVEELPLTANGKVDRRALQALEVEIAGGESVQARTPAEEILSAIWAEVLGRETVSVHDNFFELGGHSLLATQVISRVRDAFGQEVALRSLFEQPTVAGLAREIEAGRGAELHAPPMERVERAERLPLSFAQQRLWFLDQLEPGSSFYNIPAAVRLTGQLNVAALERTLSEIIRRHEVLRTHFIAIDGEPVQVIEAAAPIKLEVLDLSDLNEAERTAETGRLVAEESTRPFNLTTGPLLRMSLIQLGAEEHVALVMMHHIVSDGWSMGVLIREVAALYGAYLRGEESPLDELPIQYTDFAHWQRNWLQGEVLDAQLDYWRAELADAPTVIDLPIDKPRPPVQTYRGAYHPLQLSAELSSQLRDLSRQNGSTLFMTLLAAFDLLLCRYAGQEQVLVGTPIANRNRSETEGLIGFFVNTLVLRGDVRSDPSFRELLRRVRETALGAYAHQDLPFEKLVEELQPERDMSRSPLFQVMFALQNAPDEGLELEGLSLSAVESSEETAKFELMLGLQEVDGVVVGGLNYNRDLYEAETIRRLVESYERVLQAVVTDAEQQVFEIDLLSEGERQQIIEGWNDTARAYRSAGGMHRLFEAQVERTPAATALVFGDQKLSYGELNERANSLAHYLRELGVAAEDRIGILMERSPAMVVSLLGVLKAGGCYVPLDPQYPQERLKFMQTDAGVRVLLTTGALAEACGVEQSEQLRLVHVEGVEQTASSENPSVAVSEQQLAYLIYTSGSTGVPKGVAITHGSAETFLHWATETFNQQVLSGVLFSTSICFDLSIFEVFVTLSNGGKVILAENALQLPELAAASQVTLINTVPSAMAELVRMRAVPESVQVVNLAGEALSKELVAEIYATTAVQAVYNLYGPSEDTTYSTFTATRKGKPVTIGRPIANTRAYVLDANQQCVPIGVAGELYLGGEGLARGYFARPELTAEKFIPDRFSQTAGDRLYRTGDLARYRDNGELEFLGRADYQVKVRGYRIELGEIESVLRQQDQVQQAIVVIRQERLVAYVVSEGVSSAELRERVRQRLPEYMVPSAFVMLERMPLTPNGKVDRRALPDTDATSLVLGSGFVPPRTAIEQITASIWSQLLNVERIGVDDNFFELGGHSLLATQVISRVRDAFGQEVALRSLFEQPTVAGLAQTIERAQRAGVGLSAPPLVPISRDVELPLSFAQQRLWFLDQMEPGSSFYNIPAAVRLHGTLNIEALERTLSEVVRRHEVLRTRFISIDGEPVQVIEPASPITLAVLDLSDLNEAERTAETQRLVAEESARPFDLSRGPLLRVSLLCLQEDEHVALVTMHHIVSDGWSIGVLVREVAALYSAYLKGEESPLEELPIQYADFAHWQRNWLQGEVLAAQLDYWRAELADTPTAIDLPVYKPRPPVQTYRGAHHPLQLSAELSSQLKDLSRQNGSTLFMTLLAAFDLLLCRYAGQEQVLVGTPIANRNRSETEGLIGFFVNTLVLRGDVRGNPSFRELLRRVREAALGAYAHQDLPFEKLVEELQPERDMSRSPLFQVLFVLQNGPGEALELEGLSLSGVESAGDTAKFELTLALQEFDGIVAGGINYNRDLYEAETIGRMVDGYKRVLQAIAANAEQRVFEIELLSDAERRQIIEGWNESPREYTPASTLTELFEVRAARTPEATALLFENITLSYRELNERANQLAWYLQRIGVGPEVLVGILMDRSVEMIVALLGILKAGGAYVPLDPAYPAERLAFMVQDSGMRMLLTQERLSEVPGGYAGETLSLTEQWDSIAGESIANLPRNAQPEHVTYVIYTSGSTGRPKGVLVSHENVVRLLTATQTHFKFNQSDVWTLFHSYAFDFSVWEIWGALAYGGKLVIVPYWISRSAEAFHRLLVSERVTVLNQTPSAFRQLIAADQLAGEDVELKLRLVIFGGEALELQSLRPWFARHDDDTPRLVNMFGITETTVHVTYRPLSAADLELASSSVVGRPLECLQVYLLDERGQPVPIGVPGEICVGGTGLARGYLNRAELTAERFVPNPFSTMPGARLYRSGDLARYLSNGDIEYLGRIDQQVKLRGFRIELGEIETALEEHEAVRECTVVASTDANGDTKLLAYLVNGRQEPAPSVTALREFLKVKLPEYMIPAAFIMLDAMPLTPNGKIDRRALPAPDQTRPELGKELVAPRTLVEQKVAGIWEELLDVRPIGVHDDFFSLGGHSLLAVRLMARIQANFGQHLPLASLFQGATIEKQASLLHEEPHEQSASALVSIQPKGDGLPFFCVHPGGGNVLCYNGLASHLGLEQPFYGLQARGLIDHQVPHTRIEDMAAYYIEAIRSVQPDGPYLLGGWSMGGVVAYEMAQQLEAQQQRVSLLALMDSRPFVEDAAPLDEITLLINFAHDLGLSVDGLKFSTDELAKLDSEELLSYVLQRAVETRIVPEDIQLAQARRLFEVFKINVRAMQSYRPQPSSTHVTLLKAEQGRVETSDETMGWSALTSGDIEIHTVPGSHFTIVREPYVRSLAEQLADSIDKATLRSFASHT